MTGPGEDDSRSTGNGDDVQLVGEAVLRDYPLRLWARQQEHTDEVLREFKLLLSGRRTGTVTDSAPEQLVALAQMFSDRFGPRIDAATEVRRSRQAPTGWTGASRSRRARRS